MITAAQQLTSLVYVAGTSVGTGTLSLFNNGQTVETLTLSGDYSTTLFSLDSTSAGATVSLASSVACFAKGTRIGTVTGEVAVEDLRIGDHLLTSAGPSCPIRWIGRRHIDCRLHADPAGVLPIRIAAHAGHAQPSRDLYLSPEHAVFAGGALIPVFELCNGTSVHPIDVDEVTYFHIELDRHDIILAEGLAAESYFENGNRFDFDGDAAIYPNGAAPRHAYVRQGRIVEAVRAQLAVCWNVANISHAAEGKIVYDRHALQRA